MVQLGKGNLKLTHLGDQSSPLSAAAGLEKFTLEYLESSGLAISSSDNHSVNRVKLCIS